MSLHLRTLPAGFMVPCLPTSAKRPDLAAAQQFARMTMRQPTQFLEQWSSSSRARNVAMS
jgi:hypothetical protein